MKFLTGLCQDDVTTSNSDDIGLSRNKFPIHVREKISGDVTKGIFQTCHGSGVMQHIPWLVQCVLTSSDICHLVRTISNYFSVRSRRVKALFHCGNIFMKMLFRECMERYYSVFLLVLIENIFVVEQ